MLLFCNLFKACSLILFRVLIFLVLKKPEWAKRPLELKTSYEKSSHLLLFIQPIQKLYIHLFFSGHFLGDGYYRGGGALLSEGPLLPGLNSKVKN